MEPNGPSTLNDVLKGSAYLTGNILHPVRVVRLLASSAELPKVNLWKEREDSGNLFPGQDDPPPPLQQTLPWAVLGFSNSNST